MAWYGRRVTSGDTDYGQVARGTARATVYDAMSVNGWGHRIAFWGGGYVGEGDPQFRLAVYAVDGSPSHRLGYTAPLNVTANMTYGGNGAAYGGNVTNATTSPAPNAIKMYSGNRYAIAINPTGADGLFAMAAAHRINATNKNLYTRNGVSSPPDPFNHSYSSYEGHISAWIEYQPNRTPTSSTSSPSGLITSTTPTFNGSFSDADSIYGDRMTRLRIQVIRSSDAYVMWDSGMLNATSGEKSSGSYSRSYGGSTLQAGVTYAWRAQVADEFGAWSTWSSYRSFTVNGGGSVTPFGGFHGKQNTQKPSPFTATWNHSSGLSMNAVQVRIKQGTTILRTGSIVSKSVSNGNLVSTTWSEQFGSYSLGWGTNYTWEMRGRDSGNLWSNWSSGRAFSTNNPPDVPYNLSPAQSQPSSSRPILRAKATDADGDSVTVKVGIMKGASVLATIKTMTHVGGGNYEYQTTSSDLPSYDTYRWFAYSYDGHLYSGGTTSESGAAKSQEAAFIYGAGPTVTITSPSTTVTTSSFTVTWTASDQQKYRVLLTQDGNTIYDTGTVTSTSKSRTIPSGYIRHGESYDLVVYVTNSAPLTGASEVRSFSVSYPLPDPVTNFTASPEYQRFDMAPSSVRLTWDESTDPNFAEYLIIRDDGHHPTILARINSPQQIVFVDYMPESGVTYDYAIVQAVTEGLDTIASEAVHAQARVDLMHVVLNDTNNGDNRVGLAFDEERGIQHVDDLVLEHPWGQQRPTGVYGTAQYHTFSGSFKLITDELATAKDHIEALRTLWASRATVCYRDERGRKFFGKIRRFNEQDRRIQFYNVELEIVEIGYHEGDHENEEEYLH